MRNTSVLALFLSLFFSLGTRAQVNLSLSDLAATVKAPYQELDSTKVSTGYLMDQAVDFVKVGLMDGQSLCDSNYVDVSLYRDLFRTMNYAKVNNSVVLYDADAIYEALTSSQYIKLSSALFQYNYIVEDAIAEELIEYNSSTDRFNDHTVNGIWQNPYGIDYVFMFTAGKHIKTGTTVTYDISNLIAYTNCDVSGISIQIDFGNGIYSSVPGNTSLHQVVYDDFGVKELRLKVTLNNTVVLESHTSIDIIPNNISPMASGSSQADSTFTVNYGDISALCSVKYYSSHLGKAVKPLIYVEGFDHPVVCGLQQLLSFTNIAGCFDDIVNDRCSGNLNFNSSEYSDIVNSTYQYDLFYVDWQNPEADITDNAELLKIIIQEVNKRKPSDGSGERTVIVAHSMGGLITRCALREMELSGEHHQVDCFVSQDVPHLGAVVPIGAQYTLRDLHHCFFGHSGNAGLGWIPSVKTFADKVIGVLDCDSARQMMYEYVNDNCVIESGSNSMHYQFQSYLDEIGFPKGDAGHPIENLTIISGNHLDSSELSGKLLQFGLSLSKLHVITPPYLPKNLSVYVSVDRDRQSGTAVSTTIVAYSHFTRSRPVMVIPLMAFTHTSTGNTGHYDVVPGSYLELAEPPWILSNNPFLYFDTANKMVFIPAASALAVEGYNASNYNIPSAFVNNCPFDSYCFEEDAMWHAYYLSVYLDWIVAQTEMSVSVPSLVLTGDSFFVYNKPSGVSNETWSSSNSAVAHFSNGTITVNNPGGLVTLSYRSTFEMTVSYTWPSGAKEDHSQYRYYSKRRRVLAGFPDMTLSANYANSNYYTISAVCTSTDNELRSKVDELAGNGDLRFIWGYKTGENSYSWQDTTSTRSFLATAQPGVVTRVAMLMSNTYNGVERVSAEPAIITIDRRPNDPFFYEPGIIYVGHNDHICNYSVLSGTSVSSNEYLGVWINPNYSPAPSAPTNVLIGSEPLPLETTCQVSIDGESTVVYCFDLFSSTTVQAALASPPSPPSNPTPFLPVYLPTLVPVKIRNGNTVLQEFYLSIYFD